MALFQEDGSYNFKLCCSFQWSPTKLLCQLNSECEPENVTMNGDYFYCVKPLKPVTLVNGNPDPNVQVLGGKHLKEMTTILSNSSRIMEVFCCTVFENGTAKLLTFEGGVNFLTCGNKKSCENICSSEENDQGIEAANLTDTGNISVIPSF